MTSPIAQAPFYSTTAKKQGVVVSDNPLFMQRYLVRPAGFEPTTPWFVALPNPFQNRLTRRDVVARPPCYPEKMPLRVTH